MGDIRLLEHQVDEVAYLLVAKDYHVPIENVGRCGLSTCRHGAQSTGQPITGFHHQRGHSHAEGIHQYRQGVNLGTQQTGNGCRAQEKCR
jgi:hypothetical protein